MNTAPHRSRPAREDGAASDRFASDLNPTGMYFVITLVTEAMATAWLAMMPQDEQRHLRPRRVEAYCVARKSDRWCLHHQGIAFDTEGLLRDGQHRLWMIKKTGLPTVLVVAYNVPKESFLHVDESLPRGIRDALKMAGKGDFSNSICSTARVLYSYPHSEVYAAAIPKEVILRRLQDWAEDLAFAEDSLERATGMSRSVRALVARAHAHLPEGAHERLREWCRILKDGMPGCLETDGAAIAYRNTLLSRINGSGSQVEIEKYRKGQTALMTFLQGQTMSRVYGTERDLFPIPEDRIEEVADEEETKAEESP